MPGRCRLQRIARCISGRSSSAAIALSFSTPSWTCGQMSARNGRMRWRWSPSRRSGVAAELAGEDAVRERAVGDDGDVVLGAEGDEVVLGVAPDQVVAELVGVDAAGLLHLAHQLDREVADAGGADLALRRGRLPAPPCAGACRGRSAASGYSRGRYSRSRGGAGSRRSRRSSRRRWSRPGSTWRRGRSRPGGLRGSGRRSPRNGRRRSRRRCRSGGCRRRRRPRWRRGAARPPRRGRSRARTRSRRSRAGAGRGDAPMRTGLIEGSTGVVSMGVSL